MKYNSVSDIIGPVMIGPSSSHTAGAVRIGQIARSIYGGQAESAEIIFYGSFAHTFKGHGTDVAIVGGLLGLSTFDERIPKAIELAKEEGMKVIISVSDDPVRHPNTARIKLSGSKGDLEVVGESVGGGSVCMIEMNGFRMQVYGDVPTLIVMHRDKAGVIATITDVFARHKVNISHMEVSRLNKGDIALMSLETDEPISEDILLDLRKLENTERVVNVKL